MVYVYNSEDGAREFLRNMSDYVLPGTASEDFIITLRNFNAKLE
jgi:hypothetical protein